MIVAVAARVAGAVASSLQLLPLLLLFALRILLLCLCVSVGNTHADEWRILALRVDFPLEEPDELTTTGRGKFDLRGFREARPDYSFPYDTPPHDAEYFGHHLDALSRYYQTVSEGQVKIEHAIFPVEREAAYTMPGTALSYGNGRSEAEIGTKWIELIETALDSAAADPAGPCFAEYNSFLVIHAGVGHETGELNDIRSVYLNTSDLFEFRGGPIQVGDGTCGREIADAWILPESLSASGRAGMNGLIAKFFGNQLGLIGLSNFADGLPALGAWSLMDVGANVRGFVLQDSLLFTLGFIPPHPMAWSKTRLGWIEPVVVERDTTLRLVATDRHADLPKAIRIPITDTEYFLMENRVQRANRNVPIGVTSPLEADETVWIDAATIEFSRNDEAGVWRGVDEYDAFVPGSGVLIWHVDDRIIADKIESGAINNDPVRQGITLEEADGFRDVGNPIFSRLDLIEGSPDDPFSADGTPIFSTETTPNSLTNTGMVSGLRVEVLSPPGDTVEVAIRFERQRPGWPLPAINGRELQSVDLTGDGELELMWTDDIGIHTSSVASTQESWSIPDALFLAAGDVDADGTWEVFAQIGSVVSAWRFGESNPLWSWNAGETVAFAGFLDASLDRTAIALTTSGLTFLDAATGAELGRYVITADALATADLDGDGDRDLVIAENGEILRLENSGFRSIGQVGNADEAWLISGDLNGDGKAELVHAASDGKVSTVSALRYSLEASFSSVVGAPALGDVDGDGLLEIVVSSPKQLHVFDVNGLPHADFPNDPAEFLELGPILTGPVLGDLDGDERQEIFLGTAKGVFGVDSDGPRLSGLPLLSSSAVSSTPVVIDLSGDGILDLAASASSGVYVWDPRSVSDRYEGTVAHWPQDGFDARKISAAPALASGAVVVTDELLSPALVYCYPNPADSGDNVHLRFFLARPARLTMEVFDAIGNKVDRIERDSGLLTPSENQISWSLRKYASGLYICRLRAKESSGNEEEVFVRLAVSN